MKFYVAARTAREQEVKEIIHTLTEHGHQVSHDWTTLDYTLERPYPPDLAADCAKKDLDGVKNADVLILLSDSGVSGMYVELGYALATGTKIYSVGAHNGHTVFQFLPQIIRVAAIKDVYRDLGISTAEASA